MKIFSQKTGMSRWFDRLPDYVTLALVVVCGSLLARLTWLVFPDRPDILAEVQAQQQLAAAQVQLVPARAERVNTGDEVARYHLFGQVQLAALQQPQVVSPTVAPKPRQAISLVGVYPLKGKEGLAILEIDGQQKVFKIDEPIVIRINHENKDTGAVLRQVTDTSATLEWNGSDQQIIPLKSSRRQVSRSTGQTNSIDSNLNGSSAIPAVGINPVIDIPQPEAPKQGELPDSTLPQLPDTTQAPNLRQFRAQALANNERLMDMLTVSPAKVEGKLLGFRVNPGSNKPLFQSAGLQAEDIVTAVNDIPLTDLSRSSQVIQTLTQASAVRLKVLRSGAEITIERDF